MLLRLRTAAAVAGPFEDALPKFTADSFGDTGEAVEAIADSGNPRAAEVVQALQDGRLLFDAAAKKVYIKTAAGPVVDAETGAAVASPPAGLTAVRLNNRLRRTVEAALG